MSTDHPTLFAALAAPFQPHQVRERDQKGRTLHYITARTAMNRLDDVLGPENWQDDYVPFADGSVKCLLTIVLPDGKFVTKHGIGGITEMHDSSDTDKTGESDALKRAAVKFGIARYLYKDGVPSFVESVLGRSPEVAGTPEPAPPPADRREPDRRPQGQDRPPQGRGGNGQANGDGRPPRTGRALFAWVKEQEQLGAAELLKWLNAWAKKCDLPGRMVDWNEAEVADAYQEANRLLSSR